MKRFALIMIVCLPGCGGSEEQEASRLPEGKACSVIEVINSTPIIALVGDKNDAPILSPGDHVRVISDKAPSVMKPLRTPSGEIGPTFEKFDHRYVSVQVITGRLKDRNGTIRRLHLLPE